MKYQRKIITPAESHTHHFNVDNKGMRSCMSHSYKVN